MDKNSRNDTEKSKYPERSSALQSELVKTSGYNVKISKKIRNQGKNSRKSILEEENWLKEAEANQI